MMDGAIVSDYTTLLRRIRERIEELGINHETLDAVAGFQTGYSSKLLCDPPIKRMGPLFLFIMLQSLGLEIELKKRPEMLHKALVRRDRPRVLRARSITLTPDFYSRIGRAGNAAKMIKIPAWRRQEIARNAILVRWQRVKNNAPSSSGVARGSSETDAGMVKKNAKRRLPSPSR